ncbi:MULTISPECIES: ImmA/IrrE family metallo-endopeptidase [unclassified Rhizobium]|uniref:ImmA/IrrE family metallo-endopeptidase n=1 Tax=unclassified Rhizobium TaxID=2613769 RepID=UPI0017AAD8E5|nr:ImmA/IrrE family metallo-endopeptidase [Rhizobium sp. UBA1881]
MKLSAFDRIDAKQFLESLGFVVWSPLEVPGIAADHLNQLTSIDPDSWSGVTIREGGATAVIINNIHPPARQANTMMHEWAHIELRHKPNRVDRSDAGLLLLSDYPAEFEDEADWLAGAILAPRDGLMRFRTSGMTPDEIALHYGISIELTNWRLRMTGIEKQMYARRQLGR